MAFAPVFRAVSLRVLPLAVLVAIAAGIVALNNESGILKGELAAQCGVTFGGWTEEAKGQVQPGGSYYGDPVVFDQFSPDGGGGGGGQGDPSGVFSFNRDSILQDCLATADITFVRGSFTVAPGTDLNGLTVQMNIGVDDGARVFLNGNALPAGEVSLGGGSVSLLGSAMRIGQNTLLVMHTDNCAVGSSLSISFDAFCENPTPPPDPCKTSGAECGETSECCTQEPALSCVQDLNVRQQKLICQGCAALGATCGGPVSCCPSADAQKKTYCDANINVLSYFDGMPEPIALGTCKEEFICGNDDIDAGEQCDDGNREDGDGCSSTCQNENFYCVEGAYARKCTNQKVCVERASFCDECRSSGGERTPGLYNSTSCDGEFDKCQIYTLADAPYELPDCVGNPTGSGCIAGVCVNAGGERRPGCAVSVASCKKYTDPPDFVGASVYADEGGYATKNECDTACFGAGGGLNVGGGGGGDPGMFGVTGGTNGTIGTIGGNGGLFSGVFGGTFGGGTLGGGPGGGGADGGPVPLAGGGTDGGGGIDGGGGDDGGGGTDGGGTGSSGSIGPSSASTSVSSSVRSLSSSRQSNSSSRISSSSRSSSSSSRSAASSSVRSGSTSSASSIRSSASSLRSSSSFFSRSSSSVTSGPILVFASSVRSSSSRSSLSSSRSSSSSVSSSSSISSRSSESSSRRSSSSSDQWAWSSMSYGSSAPFPLTYVIPPQASFDPSLLPPIPSPLPTVGNGTLDPGEECDDANRFDLDGCSSYALFERGSCGDGTIQSLLGEQCEPSLPSFLPCQANCRYLLSTCGNGTLERGESCDNGTQNSNDPLSTCRPDCSPARCGDSVLSPGEQCDDGNRLPGDGCDAFCRAERSGAPLTQQTGTLPASIIDLPNQPGKPGSVPAGSISSPLPSVPQTTSSGPETIVLMAAGAAAGYAWMRRRTR